MTPPVCLRSDRRLAIRAIVAASSVLAGYGQVTGTGTTPDYTSESIVNSATQSAGALAPNTIATLYGTNLAFSTRAVTNSDIIGGKMPTSLDGVAVWVNSTPCSLFFISPTQINFLVPYQYTAGTLPLLVVRDGQAGPTVNIQLNNTSPGLFVWNGNNVVAGHLSGQTISASAPAVPGEIVIIYAAGLGRTSPDTSSGQLATAAFPIYHASELQALFDGLPCPPGSILYAGLAPGFAGLYQINLKLPADLTSNPRMQIAVGAQISPASVQLIVQAPVAVP